MTIPAFAEFFRAANGGQSPFPWQSRLAALLRAGEAPSWVTVPTGLGKTAFIDAWAWALAVQAAQPQRTLPTRLIFTVNRRGIVDAAYDRAATLAALLRSPSSDELAWAADALRTCGHALVEPLQVTRMRGGISWDWRWLRQPDQPAVVTATVDQFGSRLLFRGYGVGDRLLAIDAALVGTDSLVVLDEAHISEPLAETIASVRRIQSEASVSPVTYRQLGFVRMTATPPAKVDIGETVLNVDDADRADPVASLRLESEKQLRLVEVEADPRSVAELFADAAATTVSALIERLSGVDDATVLVVMNTVAMARSIHERVSKLPVDSALLVGTCRSVERTEADRAWRERMSAGRIRSRERVRPFVLVSTQTVEVGADIDADALVTEACSLDALIQRLGRLDRLGRLTDTHGRADAVLLHADARHRSTESSCWSVYEHAASGVVDHLEGEAGPKLRSAKGHPLRIDNAPFLRVGPSALAELLDRGVPHARVLRTPTHAPVLLPTAVRGWAQTSPRPVPDRAVAPYIHGPGRGDAEIALCWRDLNGPLFRELLEALPPVSGETVAVRFPAAMVFLLDRIEAVPMDPSDTVDASGFAESTRQTVARVTFAVEGDGEWIKFAAGQPVIRDLLRPGATVVVDVEAGGHDTWCWNPGSTEPVQEVLDFVERRIHATVVSKRRLESLRLWSSESVREAFASMVSAADGTSSDLEEALRVVVDSLHSVPVSSTYQQLYTQQLTGIVGQSDSSAEVIILTPEVEDFDEDVADRHDGESSGTASGDLVFLITRGRRAVRRVDAAQLGVGDQSDDATSRTAREPVSLDSHLTAVGERAAAMAAALGVDARLVELVRRAADLHDLGKADRRFQTILRNGDWLGAEIVDQMDPLTRAGLLAKSGAGRRRRGGLIPSEEMWPKGLRHEAVSFDLLQSSTGWHVDLSEGERDLVLHLAGAHHGCCRPLFPPVLDHHPTPVAVHRGDVGYSTDGRGTPIDWDHPKRFASLNATYSPWGLALLETIVRLADLWVSEEGG